MEEQVNTKKSAQKLNVNSVSFKFSVDKYSIDAETADILIAKSSLYEEPPVPPTPPTPPAPLETLPSGTPDICPLCGKDMERHDICELEDYDVYNCMSCGSILFDPPIHEGFIDNFYSEIAPETVHRPNHKKVIEKYKKLFAKIFPRTKGKTLIDVDSTQGYVVEAAKGLNFKTVKGIDKYDFHTSFQKENFGEKFFETVSLDEYVSENREQADIVTSIENLCMQPNIDRYIENLAKITKSGGTLYIEEVDGNSYFLPTDLTRWNYMFPPITCNFISKDALYSLLNKHGFKVKKKLLNWGYMMKIIAVKAK